MMVILHRWWRSLLLLGFLVLIYSGCSSSSGDSKSGCTQDSDCPKQYVCASASHICVYKTCDQDNGGCDSHAVCAMTGGVPKCECQTPLVGDGLTCRAAIIWQNLSSGASLDGAMHNSTHANIGILAQPTPIGPNGSYVMSNAGHKNVGGFLAQ